MNEQSPSIAAKSSAALWLTEAETANRLNMSQKWLQKMRFCGGGPRYAKFGAAVRYSIADIEDFERESLRQSTSDPGNAG